MSSAADRIDLGPPRDAGSVRAFGLALLAHGLLIAALTWGVNWKRTDDTVAFEAEIWSAVRQEAAPKLVEPMPVPAPAPAPSPAPAPAPPEAVARPAPPGPDADIALQQEKKRKRVLQQQQQQQREDAAQLAKKEKEKEKEKERDLKIKEDFGKRKALDDAKKLEAKKLDAKEQASASSLAEQRKQNLARAMGLAGASGADAAKGSALKSAGPSASYGGKVKAKVRPNIVFTEDIQGNPSAEVEVRTGLDGTITSQRLVKSSGNKAWDDAVMKAVIRTETMPRDTDGRVPTPMIIEFKPKD